MPAGGGSSEQLAITCIYANCTPGKTPKVGRLDRHRMARALRAEPERRSAHAAREAVRTRLRGMLLRLPAGAPARALVRWLLRHIGDCRRSRPTLSADLHCPVSSGGGAAAADLPVTPGRGPPRDPAGLGCHALQAKQGHPSACLQNNTCGNSLQVPEGHRRETYPAALSEAGFPCVLPRLLTPISRAFTLIELLVVISIISILAAMLLPALNKGKDKAKEIRAISDVKQVMTGNEMYSNDFGDKFPPGDPAGMGRISFLETQLSGYVDSDVIFTDPWQNPLIFTNMVDSPATVRIRGPPIGVGQPYNPTTYQLLSKGLDQDAGGQGIDPENFDNIWVDTRNKRVVKFREVKDQEGL